MATFSIEAADTLFVTSLLELDLEESESLEPEPLLEDEESDEESLSLSPYPLTDPLLEVSDEFSSSPYSLESEFDPS